MSIRVATPSKDATAKRDNSRPMIVTGLAVQHCILDAHVSGFGLSTWSTKQALEGLVCAESGSRAKPSVPGLRLRVHSR